jgi:hypothetical protein
LNQIAGPPQLEIGSNADPFSDRQEDPHREHPNCKPFFCHARFRDTTLDPSEGDGRRTSDFEDLLGQIIPTFADGGGIRIGQ